MVDRECLQELSYLDEWFAHPDFMTDTRSLLAYIRLLLLNSTVGKIFKEASVWLRVVLRYEHDTL